MVYNGSNSYKRCFGFSTWIYFESDLLMSNVKISENQLLETHL